MQPITVTTTIQAPVEEVWERYTDPAHIVRWNNASDDWHTPEAENDLRPGGKFRSRMEAKDGSAGFDFEGVYDKVEPNALIAYTMGDGRKARITFTKKDDGTKVSVTFDPESENPIEMQREGWQAILDNFGKYVQQSQ